LNLIAGEQITQAVAIAMALEPIEREAAKARELSGKKQPWRNHEIGAPVHVA